MSENNSKRSHHHHHRSGDSSNENTNNGAPSSGAADSVDTQPPHSLSIEETNTLRRKLGLKPLNIPQPKQQQQQSVKSNTTPTIKESDTQSKHQKEPAKKESEDEKEEALPSLGDILMKEEGENSDLKAWVAKSREAEKQQRLKRVISRARGHSGCAGEEQNKAEAYDEEDLQGLRVAHDLGSALAEGEEMVLTLADAPVLKDGKLNDDEDVLENTDLREKERWAKARAAAQPAAYDKYGDWEFEELRKGGDLPQRGAKQSLLPQYDGVDSISGDIDINAQAATVYRIGNTCPKGTADIMQRLQVLDASTNAKNGSVGVGNGIKTLSGDSAGVSNGGVKEENGSDDVFKKSGAKKKRKISAQKRMQLSIEALIGEVATESDQQEIDQGNEHGSRAARKASDTKKKQAEDVVREMELRQKSYERVVERSRKNAIVDSFGGSSGDVIDDEENNFYRSLSAATAARAKSSTRVGNNFVKVGQQNETDWTQKYGNGLVVSQVTEFVKSVKNEDDESSSSSSSLLPPSFKRHEKEEEEEEITDKKHTETSLTSTSENENKATKKETEKREEKEYEGTVFSGEEPLYSEGLGATLKLLQQKGGIEKVEREMQYQIGRSKDGEFQRNEKGDHIILEYTDEDGNALKPKEAFRQLSHIFHGRNPNKKRMAKMQKKLQEERAKVNMPSTDTPLHSAEALKKITERLHQPYMVLSGCRATGQFAEDKSMIINREELKRKQPQKSSNDSSNSNSNKKFKRN